jgi:endoglucanase
MSKTAAAIVLITMVLAVTIGLNYVMAAEPNTQQTKIDAFKMNQLLGRGVNMGNALDAPSEGAWGFTLEEKYFQAAKDAGFNSVRIPVRWSAHAMTQPPYTIDPNFMKRVDWAVNCALSRNMPVMLNVHHYYELFSDPNSHRERFLAIWQQIAEHYKDYPQILLFEPINEPSGKLSGRVLNSALKQTIAVIRKSNPDRIVVAGSVWNVAGTLASLEIPKDDRNIIVSIHSYDPMEFTHQGAPWVTDRDSNSWLGTKWTGTDSEKKAIIKNFDIAAAWAKQNNRPINLGEFGSINKADMESRARYTKFFADTAIERGFSFHYWQFDSDFAVYDTKTDTWIKPLLEALIPHAVSLPNPPKQ